MTKSSLNLGLGLFFSVVKMMDVNL